MIRTSGAVRVLGSVCFLGLTSCPNFLPTVDIPVVETASTLAIFPGQVAYGQIDLNGGAYSHIDPVTVVATGGQVLSGYSWTLTPGSLQPHPVIAINALQGYVTGRSTTLRQGTYTLFVDVNDDHGTVRSGRVTIDLTSTCNSNPAAFNPCASAGLSNVHIDYLPTGRVGASYAASIITGGGTPSYRWALAAGTLPPGISISGRGVLLGTPTVAGTYRFYIQTIDAANNTTNNEIAAGSLAARFQLVVNP